MAIKVERQRVKDNRMGKSIVAMERNEVSRRSRKCVKIGEHAGFMKENAVSIPA